MASYDINGQKQFLVGLEQLDGEGFGTFRTSSKRFAKQIKSIATELCLKKEEMEHKIAQYQGVLNTTKKKKKT